MQVVEHTRCSRKFIGKSLGAAKILHMSKVLRVVVVFVAFPVFSSCAIGVRLFSGRAGGIMNALRIRNVRGIHELYESPARKQG